MRSEKEKKSITKSIKLSPLQVQQIEEKAKEKNLTFSSYMVDCAVQGNNSITPQMAVRMQELVTMVLEIVLTVQNIFEKKNCGRKHMIWTAYLLLYHRKKSMKTWSKRWACL